MENVPNFETLYLQSETEIVIGSELTEEQIESSVQIYVDFRDENDEEIKIGLFGDEVKKALVDPGSYLIKYSKDGVSDVFVPLLVPTRSLDWYNIKLLERTYGSDRDFLFYAHPPIPLDDHNSEKIWSSLREVLNSGSVVIMDQYQVENEASQKVLQGINLGSSEEQYSIEALGGGGLERKVDIYVGEVSITNGDNIIKEAPNVFQVYDEALEAGEISVNHYNGVTLERVIEGEEAERLWKIYENPFDELGEEDPTYAGYGHEELITILQDPNIAKLINRVDGKISTLCFFLNDFELVPWFNKRAYEKRFPDYVSTNNVLMFPGIVSDETMRGNNYSLDVIDLAAFLYAKRGSNFLITFECTEISTQYIPSIVKGAVEHGGFVEVSGLDSPVSVMDYMALVKR